MTGAKTTGHCKDQKHGCLEFRLLKQYVEEIIEPKADKVEEFDSKMDRVDDRVRNLLYATITLVITVALGSAGLIVTILKTSS